jgi:adenylylsulfate kinase
MSQTLDHTTGVLGWAAPPSGATVWLTGLPSSGKTTIAVAVAERLRADGHRVQVLDGDELRRNLTADLGYSRADRDTNVRRVGVVAELLARNGVLVLVPVIAPYADSRAAVRAHHDEYGTAYVEVHVATDVAVCEQRDVKGWYAKARSGELTGLTGIDDPYEVPARPELRLDTAGSDVTESVDAVLALLHAEEIA